MRKVTLSELFDRGRQALISRAEGIGPINRLLSGKSRRSGGTRIDADALTEMFPLPAIEDLRLATSPQHLTASGRTEALQLAARDALAGRVPVLGLGVLDFGSPIDWHLDPTTGRRSPRLPWKALDSLDTRVTGDKKIVWELNRHHHLVTMAQAFIETGDARFAGGVVEHIEHWIASNPSGRGVNWVSSLEIAFRCINWIWSLALIREGPGPDEPSRARIAESLRRQGVHVARYLSRYTSPNTHLTGEALGLWCLGHALRGEPEADGWRATGRQILRDAAAVHVRDDGVYFEQSSWYQRYTAEFYLFWAILSRRLGEEIPPAVLGRVERLVEHLAWLVRPDGTFPLVGDDDGGRLFHLAQREATDWRDVLSTAGVFFGRADFKYLSGGLAEETIWLLGPGAGKAFAALEPSPPPQRSKCFPEGGYHVMRSGWDARAHATLFDCGPHGTLNCGHAHADALAFEIVACGETFAIDPGTFSYTGSPGDRDRFRSTSMHNTVTVDGMPSSEPDGLFQWKSIARCDLTHWIDHPRLTFVAGAHDGFERLPDPVVHHRAIFFPREYWIVADRLEAGGAHQYESRIHLAPGIRVRREKDERHLVASSGRTALDLVAFGDGVWRHGVSDVSRCYGSRQEAEVVTLDWTASGPSSQLLVVTPRSTCDGPPSFLALATDGGRGVRIALSQATDAILWSVRRCPGEAVIENDFLWAWMRRGPNTFVACLVDGSRFDGDDLRVRARSRIGSLCVERRAGHVRIDLSPPADVSLDVGDGIASVSAGAGLQVQRNGSLIEIRKAGGGGPNASTDGKEAN